MNDGQAVGAAGPFEIIRGQIPRRNRSGRSAQPHHPGSRARAAQRPRPGRVRRDVRAGEAGRPGEEPRVSCSIRSSIVATGRPSPAPRATSRSSAAGRATSSPPASTRRSSCRSPCRRTARPITGPVLARFFDVADGTHHRALFARLARARAQPYPPVDLAQPAATLTVAHLGDVRAASQDAATTGAARRRGRSPTARPRRFPARPTRRVSA